jgi:hypothetical protein
MASYSTCFNKSVVMHLDIVLISCMRALSHAVNAGLPLKVRLGSLNVSESDGQSCER